MPGDGGDEPFTTLEIRLMRQVSGFGFRIIGGREEGSQVGLGGSGLAQGIREWVIGFRCGGLTGSGWGSVAWEWVGPTESGGGANRNRVGVALKEFGVGWVQGPGSGWGQQWDGSGWGS